MPIANPIDGSEILGQLESMEWNVTLRESHESSERLRRVVLACVM
jgi:hypothetical protein